jgi:hypothetical protein
MHPCRISALPFCLAVLVTEGGDRLTDCLSFLQVYFSGETPGISSRFVSSSPGVSLFVSVLQ